MSNETANVKEFGGELSQGTEEGTIAMAEITAIETGTVRDFVKDADKYAAKSSPEALEQEAVNIKWKSAFQDGAERSQMLTVTRIGDKINSRSNAGRVLEMRKGEAFKVGSKLKVVFTNGFERIYMPAK